MFPFRKKKVDPTAPKKPAVKDIPGYRRDERLVDYGTMTKADESPARVEGGRNPAANPATDGFQPLPRCPRCGTAISHSQKTCHGCEEDFGGF
jgi:hypothetical protein